MEDSYSINSVNNAIIFGAGHGIGFGIAKHLLENTDVSQVFATYRIKEKASALLDLEDEFRARLETKMINPLIEEELANLASDFTQFDLLINAIGVLHNSEELYPEKSLGEVNLENLTHSFQVNAALAPLLAKHFKPAKNNISAFVSISAKVGSISDNRMGGWYAYRASKAALNMFLKNISLEYKRKHRKCVVLSIHPGTTITDLSAPFTDKTSLTLHTISDTAKNIMNVIEKKTIEDSGKFYSWDGEELPW